jgi:hypothetical protein
MYRVRPKWRKWAFWRVLEFAKLANFRRVLEFDKFAGEWPLLNIFPLITGKSNQEKQTIAYLVCLHSPDFHDSLVDVEHVELVLLVEDGATVRAGVVGQIKTRRIRLGQEVTDVSQTFQRLSEEFEMVDFLKHDDVGVVSSDLFQHPETTRPPVQSFLRTSNEFVVLCSDR